MTTKRILIVEDEVLIAISLEAALAGRGYDTVGPFNRVDQAVAAVECEQLDAAVLDVNLGGDKVFPVAVALSEKNVPFIFLTGYASLQLPEEYRTAVVLAKPFQDQHVVDCVTSMVGP